MGQVAAVRQAHREDGLAGLEEGTVDRLVSAGSTVRLDIGVIGAEEILAALDREILGLVNLGAAAVVAAAGIALGILIGQGRAERREHAWAGEILAGDQLQATADAAKLGK